MTPNTVPVTGGTRVTILGDHFLGVANVCAVQEAVYFGSDPQYDYPLTASSFQVVSNNEIIEVRQIHEMSDCPEDVQKAAEGFEDLPNSAAAKA